MVQETCRRMGAVEILRSSYTTRSASFRVTAAVDLWELVHNSLVHTFSVRPNGDGTSLIVMIVYAGPNTPAEKAAKMKRLRSQWSSLRVGSVADAVATMRLEETNARCSYTPGSSVVLGLHLLTRDHVAGLPAYVRAMRVQCVCGGEFEGSESMELLLQLKQE